jgi:hypothetical protein
VRTSRLSEARRRLLVRGRNLSCEAKIARARRRLLVRDGDLSEKPSFSRRLVEEASNWSETRHLDSDGFDWDSQSSLC